MTRLIRHVRSPASIMCPDVVVVGAGPAGLLAAHVLSENGVDFRLFSRERVPGQEKSCGGFVPARMFTELGLRPFAGCWAIDAVRLKFPEMDPVRVEFHRPVGYDVARDQLGLALLERVRHYEEFVQLETEVRSASIDSSGCELTVDGPSGQEPVKAKILIDCSGANPVSLRHGYVRPRIPNSKMGYGRQYIFEREPGADEYGNAIDFFYGHEYSPGGYAWLYPRRDTAVVGSGGLVSRVREDATPIDAYLHRFMDHVVIGEQLRGSHVIRKEAALMPLAGVVTPSFSDRVLLAGDAAGHCSPISGEGIFYSAVGGECAGTVASQAVQEDDFSKKALSRYEEMWRSRIGSDLRWGAWLQSRLLGGGSGSLGSSLLKSEKYQRIIAEMLVGERSVRHAILACAPGYLRAKIGF